MVRGLYVLASLCLAVAATSPAGAQTLYVDELFGFTRTAGVVFASKLVGSPPTNVDLRLELFEPQGAGVPTSRPAIILIHGGGFTGGSRFNARLIEMCERMAQAIAAAAEDGWTATSAPDESSRPGPGGFAVFVGHFTGDQRCDVADGLLHEAAAPGRQVADQRGPATAQVCEVD